MTGGEEEEELGAADESGVTKTPAKPAAEKVARRAVGQGAFGGGDGSSGERFRAEEADAEKVCESWSPWTMTSCRPSGEKSLHVAMACGNREKFCRRLSRSQAVHPRARAR